MRTVTSIVRLVPMVALACVLASCSSEPTEVESAPTPSALGRAAKGIDFATGYPLPDCTDAKGEPCITNGFDPARDGFGFANWGEQGTIGATEMIALFGRKKVCASGSGDACTMYPAATQWAEQVNEAMAGGHCEGMAVLSARLFLGAEEINELDPKAGGTFDLDPSDSDVISAIDMWFATQYLDPVVAAYKAYQKLTPTEIASALIDGLEAGSGYTIGIYSEDGGHAVTPIGVGLEGDQVAISIYDNNYPGTVQRIMIDPDTESWSYAAGTTEPQAPTNGWAGGTGTIELTPMESRALPAPAPFADNRRSGRNLTANRTVLVTSPDPETIAGAVLRVDGNSYDLADPAVTPPPGIQVHSTRGNSLTSGSTIVNIDSALVGEYAINATTQNPSGATVPVTMSIDAVGEPRVTVQADSTPAEASGVQLAVNEAGAVTAGTSSGSPAQVSIANGLSGASFDLAADDSLVIDTNRRGVATALLLDDEGFPRGTYTIDDETADGQVSLLDIDFDPETGEFVTTEVEADEEAVDTEFLALVGDFEDSDSTDADADADADVDVDVDVDANAVTNDAPVNGEVDDAPADDAPADDAPADDAPADDAPADDAPADDAPADDARVDDEEFTDEEPSPQE